ncbi:MAG TPA: SET domain-containing protein-lysine N-methyltransferase [Spirochaetota bacterium]|nr:SET domain-containing protein-lysine N-methyltransferase [Spirochaetota bacterium]HPJ38903.1 SET domain-containing protein-lysine N-methyltransferase [Spirochaetota bacterium]HPQ51905.1 SET domain-containing protein-lysine N-methyltransferase [Spirochaetota bacterium]
MLEKRTISDDECGLYAVQVIPKGEVIFTREDWVEDEKLGWHIITIDELDHFTEEERSEFLRYSYDIDFGKIIGTRNPETVRNLTNFINHSCDPTTMFDECENIIARRDIYPGEELSIDYGCFIVNVDQDFICSCGAANCRKFIKKDDWMMLLGEYGYCFPRFLQAAIYSITTPSRLRHSMRR